MKKNLIVFASKTGNTEKVAKEIGKNFERHGWRNILKKLPDDYDASHPDFDFNDYDFACVGSPVNSELPLKQIRTVTYGKPESRRIFPGPKCGTGLLHLWRNPPWPGGGRTGPEASRG